MARAWLQLCSILAWGILTACGAHVEPKSRGGEPATTASQNPRCPARQKAPELLPNVRPEHETLAYWLEVWKSDLDAPLLEVDALRMQERAMRLASDGDARVVDLQRVPTRDEIIDAMTRRFATMAERFQSGEYVSDEASARSLLEVSRLEGFHSAPRLHVALAPIDLRCGPFMASVRSTTGTPGLDRNACSRARAQEPIEVLGTLDGKRLARTREALGFIDDHAPLSPDVSAELAPAYRAGRELQLRASLTVEDAKLDAGAMLIMRDEDTAWIASERGFQPSPSLGDRARSTARPLTRRAFLEEAFRYLGGPYGWGDQNGGRDCSRLVLDVLRAFGLHLPRHSSEQSRAGVYTLDIPPEASETDRLSLLDESAARGVALVHFPGHIMLYLGRDLDGTPRAIHAFAEYLAPCKDGGETLFEVNRVGVSDLSLGKGTSRRAFLERATRITVFGRAPGHALLALSRFRDANAPAVNAGDTCTDSLDFALFRTPREPSTKSPLRVIASTTTESRPARLFLVDPMGVVTSPASEEYGTGPFSRVVQVEAPTAGRWTALLADGDRVLACERFRVVDTKPAAPPARAPDAPAWEARFRWERDTEHLYAAFVERLFSHPLDDLRTWSSLSELLKDPARNLLFDHLGQGEDTRLRMAPDCADLAYFLRAYFAWKVSLPFAFRQCSRGRAGVPPRCGELRPNSLPVEASDEVSAFEGYLRRYLASGVHSASGRTLPSDDQTDLYPLPLTREALLPGSVFADPYGHVIVLAKWVPQGFGGAGMLVGADAQPDASVGRRRFFRGNFLFTPDTRDVGAGFKAFRPIVRGPDGALTALTNAELQPSAEFAPPSLTQYEGTADDFYTRMDELIYPRPIAMLDRMKQVVDAFEEQVVRRVDAIDTGEAYMRTQRGPIAMPNGYDLFETTGAWEDFATPSRDMRLLIALDTVRDFPKRVASQPERFGVAPSAALESDVRARLDAELTARTFAYTRSDGSRFALRLVDVLARASALEVAYNPNDCVETRWGAAPESPEAAACKRKTPAAQRSLMETKFRPWFHDRARPPRP